MAKTMKWIAVLSVAATICFSILYLYNGFSVCKTFAITFGTTAYHFCIRLLIGNLIRQCMKHNADYTKRRYHVAMWEKKLYDKLRVKDWKAKMPTYAPNTFDLSKHSWHEIAQASCQSELVHEVNIVFSFVPVLFSVWFGAFAVFLITSVLGAAYDLLFVMMQRYNRPRILRLINRLERG